MISSKLDNIIAHAGPSALSLCKMLATQRLLESFEARAPTISVTARLKDNPDNMVLPVRPITARSKARVARLDSTHYYTVSVLMG